MYTNVSSTITTQINHAVGTSVDYGTIHVFGRLATIGTNLTCYNFIHNFPIKSPESVFSGAQLLFTNSCHLCVAHIYVGQAGVEPAQVSSG